jgi:hypothetical protein
VERGGPVCHTLGVVGRKRRSAEEIKPLTEDRKVLVLRYMIDAEEAKARWNGAEEAEGRATEAEGPMSVERPEQRVAAEARPRRQPAEAEAAPHVSSMHLLVTAFRAVVRPAVDPLISAARSLERPETGDVILGVVVCALSIGIGVAVALAT